MSLGYEPVSGIALYMNHYKQMTSPKSPSHLNVRSPLEKNCVQAVTYLHALKLPVIHRDIKPANVLISRQSGVAKLCDMGISKLKEIQTMTKTTSGIPGTPSYTVPECLLQNKKATVHSDIWSLASTLPELYTEKECWELDDTVVLDMIRRGMRLRESYEIKIALLTWKVLSRAM